jgi:hypothetical protein
MGLLLLICNDQLKENKELLSWVPTSSVPSSSNSSSSSASFKRFLQSKALSTKDELSAADLSKRDKPIWRLEDETEFLSVDLFSKWRIDFLQKISKYFPDFFRFSLFLVFLSWKTHFFLSFLPFLSFIGH